MVVEGIEPTHQQMNSRSWASCRAVVFQAGEQPGVDVAADAGQDRGLGRVGFVGGGEAEPASLAMSA
jgi:hypothetical protein